MKFIVDANLPPSLARWLASQGHEAYHVNDLGMTSTEDRTIWRHAREIGACIVTKDEDFTLLQALDPTGPTVVWIRIGNAVRSVLLRRLPGIWPSVVSAIGRGDKVIEVRFHQCFCGHSGFITGTIETLEGKRLSVDEKPGMPTPLPDHSTGSQLGSGPALPSPPRRGGLPTK